MPGNDDFDNPPLSHLPPYPSLSHFFVSYLTSSFYAQTHTIRNWYVSVFKWIHFRTKIRVEGGKSNEFHIVPLLFSWIKIVTEMMKTTILTDNYHEVQDFLKDSISTTDASFFMIRCRLKWQACLLVCSSFLDVMHYQVEVVKECVE